MRLKGATSRSIARAGGGTALAVQTRVNAPALSKYAADHETEHFMPIDIAIDTDMAAGAPVILTAMAVSLGYTLTPAEGGKPVARISAEMVGHIVRECGEAQAAILDALADGAMTPRRRQVLAKEIDEAVASLWTARAALRGE